MTWLYPVLDALKDGYIIRRYVGLLLRIAAWGTIAGGVLLEIVTLKVAFADQLPAEVTIAGVAGAVIVAFMVWAIAQAYLYHAREIAVMQKSTFVVIPIFSSLTRLMGEHVAIWCLACGLMGAVVSVVAGNFARVLTGRLEYMPGLSWFTSSSALGGIGTLMLSIGLACSLLLIAYLWAELLLVAADAAHQLGRLVAAAQSSQGHTAATALPEPIERHCPSCSAPLSDPLPRFCERCGAAL